MDKMEAYLLTALKLQANKGNKEAAAMIEAEDKIRKEKGLPTIQEELAQMIQQTKE